MYKPKKKRKAKPVLVQDFSRLNVDLLETLKNDKDTLVAYTFTTQSYGGANKFWQRDELEGLIVTVSTGATKREKINPSIDLPHYKHYVLTPEGVRWVKGLLLENA